MPIKRPQDLIEAVTSIIPMMLGLLRARGLRGLLELPKFWLFARELRRMAEEFTALLTAFRNGTLPPAPAPASWTDAPDLPYDCEPSPAAPRPAARHVPAPRARQCPAIDPSPPTADPGPDRPRTVQPRAPAAAWPRPRRRAPRPFSPLGLPAAPVTARSC
jgi:hypothetical protein